jgi:type IV pilus assembly protein PilZ
MVEKPPDDGTQKKMAVHLGTKKEFWDYYFDDGARAGVFVPHVLDVPVGAETFCEIIFIDSDARFRVRGTVIWRRLKGHTQGKNAPGCCVAFLETERPKLERVLAYVEGKEINFIRRTSPRVPTVLTVAYRTKSAFVTEFSRDLSDGGMFIKTEQPLAIGDALQIKLKVPGRWFALTLAGRVVRTDGGGMGISFSFDSERQRRRLRDVIARIAHQIRSDLRQ